MWLQQTHGKRYSPLLQSPSSPPFTALTDGSRTLAPQRTLIRHRGRRCLFGLLLTTSVLLVMFVMFQANPCSLGGLSRADACEARSLNVAHHEPLFSVTSPLPVVADIVDLIAGETWRPAGAEPAASELDEDVVTKVTAESPDVSNAAALDYFKGRWVYDPRGDKINPWAVCPVASRNSPDDDGRGAARAREVAKWVWVPDTNGLMAQVDGKEWWRWEPLELLERLVHSRMGILLVGDSLTGQHYQALARHLKNIALPKRVSLFARDVPSSYPSDLPRYQRGLHEPLFLSTAAGRALFPHLPVERWDRPVVTFVRSDHLLHRDEVKALSRSAAGVKVHRDAHPAQWREWLAHWLGSDAGSTAGQRSVIVLNTGAHWTAHGVFDPAASSASAEAAELVAAMGSLASRVFAILEPYRSQLHVIVRTTAPGHAGCSDASGQQVPTPPNASAQASEPWQLYGWERFPDLDAVWKDRVRDLIEWEAGREEELRSWKLDMMDVGEQATARGDAHNGAWRGDCLHWCASTIPFQWVRGLGAIVLGKGH